MKKTTVCFILFLLTISFSFCYAETFKQGDISIPVPDEFLDLLIIETNKDGMLFSVTEKESVEEAELIKAEIDKEKEQNAAEENEDEEDTVCENEYACPLDDEFQVEGAGWLFGIGKMTEKEANQARCNDMSGAKLFARDSRNNHYVFYYPTDVRFVRRDGGDADSLAQWKSLVVWANTIPAKILEANPKLKGDKYGNTDIDIFLARTAYLDGLNYTVASKESEKLIPNKVNVGEYIAPLLSNVIYEISFDEEKPEGDYLEIEFPDDFVKLDFFYADEYENYIRSIWGEDEIELIYKVVFEDERLSAIDIMDELYRAVEKNQ